MNYQVTITDTLLFYDQPLVVTAERAAGGLLVGWSYGPDGPDDYQHFAFVSVDQAAFDEFVCGQLGLLELVDRRGDAQTFLGLGYGAPGETLHALPCDDLPLESMPEPGMVMPAAGDLLECL